MKLLKVSLLLLFTLAGNFAFATTKLICVDVIGDENQVLAETSLVNGRATINFQDRINFGDELEALLDRYVVSVEQLSESQYLMSYSLKFASGLVLLVETKTLRLEEPMMIADFVDALEGVSDEQAADCWLLVTTK